MDEIDNRIERAREELAAAQQRAKQACDDVDVARTVLRETLVEKTGLRIGQRVMAPQSHWVRTTRTLSEITGFVLGFRETLTVHYVVVKKDGTAGVRQKDCRVEEVKVLDK